MLQRDVMFATEPATILGSAKFSSCTTAGSWQRPGCSSSWSTAGRRRFHPLGLSFGLLDTITRVSFLPVKSSTRIKLHVTVTDTALIACGSLRNGTVSVPSIERCSSMWRVCCCGLGRQEIDLLLHSRRSAETASSITLWTCAPGHHTAKRRRKCTRQLRSCK